MKLTSLIGIILVPACAGIIFFAYMHHWIVITLPGRIISDSVVAHGQEIKKNVTIFYWHQGRMKSEVTPLLIADDKATTLHHIVSNWLMILDDTGISAKKITIETVMLSGSGSDAYLSLNRSFLNKNDSTYNSWMCIESLLKTIKQSNLNIQRVHFLVHHQPMNDVHLDFSQPWPVQGFQNNTH